MVTEFVHVYTAMIQSQPTNQPIKHPTNQPANKPTSQPTNQLANQTTSQPTNQLTSWKETKNIEIKFARTCNKNEKRMPKIMRNYR